MNVKLTLDNGRVLVSEFRKLTNLKRFTERVARSNGVFPVWTTTATLHPRTGEPTMMRQRVLVNMAYVVTVEEVDPNGEAASRPQDAGHGLYTVQANDGTNLPVGTVVPKHRDPNTLDLYVVTGYNASGGELRFTPTPLQVQVQSAVSPEEGEYDDDEPGDDEF